MEPQEWRVEPQIFVNGAGSVRYRGIDGGHAIVVLRPRPPPRPQWHVHEVPGEADSERRAEFIGGGDGGESSGDDGEGGDVSWEKGLCGEEV